jgi:hypothetical protein
MDKIKKMIRRSIVILYIAVMPLVIEQSFAQEIFLHDTTISSEVTYMSNSLITAGPELTISSSGVLTLRAKERIAIMPGVYIRSGGQLHLLTGVAAAIESDEEIALPGDFSVYQNYPNPFNPNTTIRYVLPAAEEVSADIYTVFGEKVKTLFSGRQQGGQHNLVWDGTNQAGQKMSSGIYYLRIEAGEYRAVLKMTLLK